MSIFNQKIDESKIEPQDREFYEKVVKHYQDKDNRYGNGFVFKVLDDFFKKYGVEKNTV